MTPLLTQGVARLGALNELWQTRWKHSGARRLLHAWLAELIGMLPASIASRLNTHDAVQLLTWPLQDAIDTERPAVLLLSAEQVMAQRISLPLAATRNLNTVLQYELDKYTPYPPEQVSFFARVLSKQTTHAEVQLVAVARERLDVMLDACRERGLRLMAVDALSRKGERMGIDLLPNGSAKGNTRATALNRWLWLGGLAWLLAIAGLYLHQQQQMLEAMQDTVAAQRAEVQRLQKVRQQLNDSVGAASYLTELKLSRPTMSQLLAETATCLGNDSWVEQLEVRDGVQVSFSGQTKRASALINQVKTCPSLEQAQFQGIIQADDATGNERFSINARLKQGDAHALSQ